MKVLYLIYSNDVASGGHYHSCDQISRSISSSIETNIITIGNNASPILIKNPHYKGHIFYKNILNLYGLNKELHRISKDLKPDIVHCWDATVMNLILFLPALWSKKIVLSKCGGQNSTRDKWQYANSIISFSFENYNWFKIRYSYNKIGLYHIANRVRKVNLLPDKQKIEIKNEKVFNFVRISRIGISYEKTLFDTFNLIEKLNDLYNVNLYVIGKIQNREVYEAAIAYVENKKLPIKFITDERTNKASNLLYLADCVIGTGRSLMEATSLAIPTLTPVSNSDMPILVNKANFDGFFKTNFSERNFAEKESILNNLSLIKELVKKEKYYKEVSTQSLYFFKENFGVEKLDEKYFNVYSETKENVISKVSLIKMNFFYVLQTLYLIN